MPPRIIAECILPPQHKQYSSTRQLQHASCWVLAGPSSQPATAWPCTELHLNLINPEKTLQALQACPAWSDLLWVMGTWLGTGVPHYHMPLFTLFTDDHSSTISGHYSGGVWSLCLALILPDHQGLVCRAGSLLQTGWCGGCTLGLHLPGQLTQLQLASHWFSRVEVLMPQPIEALPPYQTLPVLPEPQHAVGSLA